MDITYVTCFYDIGRKSDTTFYMDHINYLLSLPLNIIFYTEPKILTKLSYIQRDTLKIILDEPIYFFSMLDRIKSAMKNYLTNNPIKDTAEFAALTLSKFDFLRKSIIDNPFHTSNFAWIDAGLHKVATHMDMLPTLIPPDKISLMLIEYTFATEILNYDFIKLCRYKVAGGLFSGPNDLMITFCDKVISTAMDFLDKDLFGLEQEFITIVFVQNKAMFKPYYGDFSDLVCNYYKPTNNIWLVMKYLYMSVNDIESYNHALDFFYRK